MGTHQRTLSRLILLFVITFYFRVEEIFLTDSPVQQFEFFATQKIFFFAALENNFVFVLSLASLVFDGALCVDALVRRRSGLLSNFGGQGAKSFSRTEISIRRNRFEARSAACNMCLSAEQPLAS